MSSPLPLPIGTLCVKIASVHFPEHVGELCTIIAHVAPGGPTVFADGAIRPGERWVYAIEFDNPNLVCPTRRWVSPPEHLRPLPGLPLSLSYEEQVSR